MLCCDQGEVYFRIHAPGPGDVNMTVPPTAGPEAGTGRLTQAVWDNATNKLVTGCPGPLCPQIFVAEGATSAWVEVGRTMSPFNPAPWKLPIAGNYELTIAVASAELQAAGGGEAKLTDDSQVDVIANYTVRNTSLVLAFDPSTRSTRSMQRQHTQFFDIYSALDEQTASLPPARNASGENNESWPGHAVPIVYRTFSSLSLDASTNAAVNQSAQDPDAAARMVKYNRTMDKWVDLWPPAHQNGPFVTELTSCACGHQCPIVLNSTLHGIAKSPASWDPNVFFSLGDEINVKMVHAGPCGNTSVASAGFRGWAEQNNLTRQTVGCGALAWEDCYNQTQATSALDLASQNPKRYYWWTRM